MTRTVPVAFSISAYQVLRNLYTVNFTCDDFTLKYALSAEPRPAPRWHFIPSLKLGLSEDQHIKHSAVGDTALVRTLNSSYGMDVLEAALWACEFELAADPVTRHARQALSGSAEERAESWDKFLRREVAASPFWPAGKVGLVKA